MITPYPILFWSNVEKSLLEDQIAFDQLRNYGHPVYDVCTRSYSQGVWRVIQSADAGEVKPRWIIQLRGDMDTDLLVKKFDLGFDMTNYIWSIILKNPSKISLNTELSKVFQSTEIYDSWTNFFFRNYFPDTYNLSSKRN